MDNKDKNNSSILSGLKKVALGITMLLPSSTHIKEDNIDSRLGDDSVPEFVNQKESADKDNKSEQVLDSKPKMPSSTEDNRLKDDLARDDLAINNTPDAKTASEIDREDRVKRVIDKKGGDLYAVELTAEILPKKHSNLLNNFEEVISQANERYGLELEVPPVVVQNLLPEHVMGYYFSDDVVYVYVGMLNEFDSEELQAMFAHEIGHKVKSELSEVREVDTLKKETIDNLDECFEEDKAAILNVDIFPQSLAFGNTTEEAINTMVNDLGVVEACAEGVAEDLIKVANAKKKEERGADEFAKSLGYGDKLANILQKVEKSGDFPSRAGNLEKYDSLADRILKLRDKGSEKDDISR